VRVIEKSLVFVGGDGGDAGTLSWTVAMVAVGGEQRAQLQVQASCRDFGLVTYM
jgi:hypothetical protein